MSRYALTEYGVLDTLANLSIPKDLGNRHYQEFLEWVDEGNVPDPLPVPTLSDLKSTQLSLINAGFESTVAAARGTYPAAEVSSWYRQEEDARKVKAGATPDNTKFLGSIATRRGISLSVQADKVIAKADAYAVIITEAIGKRQALEDQLNAATTPDEVLAIVW